jgi:hypothetical protein
MLGFSVRRLLDKSRRRYRFPAEFRQQSLGGGNMDCVLEWMKKNDVPLTRKNYLDLAYLGDLPDLDAESESMLPPEIQKQPKTRKSRKRMP